MNEGDERASVLNAAFYFLSDVRLPISIAMGYATLLQENLGVPESDASPEELKLYADETLKAVNRINEMLNEFTERLKPI